MPDIQLRRSVLYVPADRPSAIAKARTLPADAVIVDLEDAVAPEAKAAARRALETALAQPLGGELAVRINAVGSEWAEADIAFAAAIGADAVLVPKVGGPGTLRNVAEALRRHVAHEGTAIWAMIETPRALLHLPAIASLADEPDVPLACFIIGINDLALETRVPVTADRAAYVPWFMQIVAAAAAHGIDVIDGVCNDFRDDARNEGECRQARALGMAGKSLIHPSQIEAANRIFAPTAEERAAAAAIVAAFARPGNAGKGVIALDGRMLERLHLTEAERVLVLAAALTDKEAL